MSTQQTQTKKESVMVEITPLGSDQKFKLSVAMVKTMLAVKTKSGKMPTDDDCIKFVALCQARKLNPFEGDAFLIGYDTKDGAVFNLITAHQAFLKRAEINSEFDGMRSGVIVERDGKLIDLEGDFHLPSDTVVGGWAAVHFKTRSVPMMKRVRLKRFQKPWGIWQDDPAGMICKCAEADALRSAFPTMCGGMYMKEEYRDDAPGTTTLATPIFTSTPPGEPVNQPTTETKEAVSSHTKIKELCKEADITEDDLISYLQSIELVEGDTLTVDDLSADEASLVLEKWADTANAIREVIDQQKP